jgi:hypothetical protein
LPEIVEVAAYYVVAEALTTAAKQGAWRNDGDFESDGGDRRVF